MTTKRRQVLSWMYWHRWIGLVACIGMILWGLSGASHPIMTHLQPVPAQFMPPFTPVDLAQATPLPQVLSQHKLTQFEHISLAQIDGQAYYRVRLPAETKARYFALKDGHAEAEMERAHAIALACYYTGLPASKVLAVRRLSQFEQDYHPVNRLLPVWQVKFDRPDGLRAYVDTEQSRLATLVDDRRAILTQLFQWGHQWSFLQACSSLQLGVASVVLGLILASAITGWILFIKQAKTAPYRMQRGSLRWWHRNTGPWISSVLLLLATSGLLHLWMSDTQQHRPTTNTRFASNVTALDTAAWSSFSQGAWLTLDIYGRADTLFWQATPATQGAHGLPRAQVAAMHTHDHAASSHAASLPLLYRTANGQTQTITVENYAKDWLHQIASNTHTVQSVTWVTAFANEYGFIFKRLPVLKLQTQATDHLRLYVEPASGALAARINDNDGLEGFVFAYIHKWSFQSLNKEVRDGLAILAALLIASTGVVGAVLFMRSAKR